MAASLKRTNPPAVVDLTLALLGFPVNNQRSR